MTILHHLARELSKYETISNCHKNLSCEKYYILDCPIMFSCNNLMSVFIYYFIHSCLYMKLILSGDGHD